jgi:hypothetical protein
MQQWGKLCEQGIDDPNPRQQILDDLATLVKPHVQASNNKTLIMMDANDPIDSRPMDEFMDALDLWGGLHGRLPPRHTPNNLPTRTQHKIDHRIGSPGILYAMRLWAYYILPFGSDSPKSDHVILCGIDFSLDVLCGMSSASPIHDPTHPSTRILWLMDVKASGKYVAMAIQMFETDIIAQRTKILMTVAPHDGLENIRSNMNVHSTMQSMSISPKFSSQLNADASKHMDMIGHPSLPAMRDARLSQLVNGTSLQYNAWPWCRDPILCVMRLT